MTNNISSLVFLVLLFLFCFSSQTGTATATATASDSITPSKSIKDPEFIISQGGVFRLGFFGFPNSTYRYVGIWYNQIPIQTVIWVANRDKPLNDSSGTMKISKDGNLVVLSGWEEIWTSNITTPVPNTSAVLLDSGNLVLKNSDAENGLELWESFQHPSNAFMPTMKISTDLRTGKKVQLSSWKSPSDPSIGNFTLSLEPLNSPEFYVWNNNQPYFRSGPWNGQDFIGVNHANRNATHTVYSGETTLFTESQIETYTYTFSNKSWLLYLELDCHGIVVPQHWNARKEEWDKYPGQQSDCDIYGRCGTFGVCDSTKPSICSCLRGFQPRHIEEWNRKNWSSGCVRTTPLQCQNVKNGSIVGKEDGFLRLENMKVPAFLEWSSIQSGNCADQCRKNCSCVAYAYDTAIGCMLWSGNLIDMQKFSIMGVDLYIRMPSSELDKANSKSKITVIIATIGSITIVTISIVFLCCWMAKYKGKKQKSKQKLLFNKGKSVANFSMDNQFGEDLYEAKLQHLPLFSFLELVAATNYFHQSNKLGQGGFGPVYRGTLKDGKEIAVKRLSRASSQGLEEFMNEVVVISKLQHRNLVRLLGCCVEGEEKMLVYEYMPNKSLDAFLFDSVKQENLDWKKRFTIIEGISRGLLYLHRDSRLRIIHRDLKASNVLLDKDLNPKISDFGMARIFGGNENQANTNRVVGTYGYMSPEYAIQGLFSEKSDVFSFGVLLLEIVSGRKNTSFYDNQYSFTLLGYAWKLWKEGNILGLVENGINGDSNCGVEREMLRCIHVGLLCIEEFAKDRPTMSSIVSMLNSEIVDLPSPKQPAFIGRPINQEADKHFQNIGSGFSMNDITSSDFGGR